MSDELRRTEQDLIEENINALACPSGTRYPNGWARLTIDLTMMTEEQRKKLWEAERLLVEAGVSWDTGAGGGGRDWELDWSLRGATLTTKPLYCMRQEAHKERLSLTRNITWATLRRRETGRVYHYPYCSEDCQRADAEASKEFWEVLLVEQIP